MKVVINKCHGGFGLSDLAIERLTDLGFSVDDMRRIDAGLDRHLRSDPRLVRVVDELGDEANGSFAELKVVEIPDDVQWSVEEYDGKEWISEKHRTWF